MARGAGQFGPTMQFGDTGAFVSSTASVLPDESQAVALIAIINSEEWGRCRAQQLQQFQRDNGHDDINVQVTSRTNDNLGQQGFEAYAEFSVTDAAGNVTRAVVVSYYRLGRTVIGVTEEYGALDDTQTSAFFGGSYDALSAAYARVNALQST